MDIASWIILEERKQTWEIGNYLNLGALCRKSWMISYLSIYLSACPRGKNQRKSS
jgi:hypothetical protein